MTRLSDSLHWQPALGSFGIVETIADIDQAIRVILRTPKGSDPHRPDFGSNVHLYLDYPINQAVPRLAAMSDALATAKDKDVRDAADGYVSAVKELAVQANKRDAVRTRAALTALSNSCADCHYKGGPGGKLD